MSVGDKLNFEVRLAEIESLADAKTGRLWIADGLRGVRAVRPRHRLQFRYDGALD